MILLSRSMAHLHLVVRADGTGRLGAINSWLARVCTLRSGLPWRGPAGRGRVVADDGALYRTVIADLYDQGVYLVQAKYRYLRASYALFLLGFVSAGVALAVSAAVR